MSTSRLLHKLIKIKTVSFILLTPCSYLLHVGGEGGVFRQNMPIVLREKHSRLTFITEFLVLLLLLCVGGFLFVSNLLMVFQISFIKETSKTDLDSGSPTGL